jgi:ATP-dependent RNA helicase DeaD
MLQRARIQAEWTEAPDRKAIKERDRDRMLESLLQPVTIDDADRDLVERLMAERSAEEIAAMLVMTHRSNLPEPEDLLANTPQARHAEQKDRHRPGFEDVVWFRMNIGRRQNADPRWILPLLCRRGHITRNEIGAIRIAQNETHFQIPRTHADKFTDAVARTAGTESDEENILIAVSAEGPRAEARERKKGRAPVRERPAAPRRKAKPAGAKYDKGKDGKAGGKPAKGRKTGKFAHPKKRKES